jgi:hypothetical protein
MQKEETGTGDAPEVPVRDSTLIPKYICEVHIYLINLKEELGSKIMRR